MHRNEKATGIQNPTINDSVFDWLPDSSRSLMTSERLHALESRYKDTDELDRSLNLTSFLDECKDLTSECEALLSTSKSTKMDPWLTKQRKDTRNISNDSLLMRNQYDDDFDWQHETTELPSYSPFAAYDLPSLSRSTNMASEFDSEIERKLQFAKDIERKDSCISEYNQMKIQNDTLNMVKTSKEVFSRVSREIDMEIQRKLDFANSMEADYGKFSKIKSYDKDFEQLLKPKDKNTWEKPVKKADPQKARAENPKSKKNNQSSMPENKKEFNGSEFTTSTPIRQLPKPKCVKSNNKVVPLQRSKPSLQLGLTKNEDELLMKIEQQYESKRNISKRPREEDLYASNMVDSKLPSPKRVKGLESDDSGVDVEFTDSSRDTEENEASNGGASIEKSPDVDKANDGKIEKTEEDSNAKDLECAICHTEGDATNSLTCGKCTKLYHAECYMPPLTTEHMDVWTCLMCATVEEIQELPNETSRGTKCLSERELQVCRRLTLGMYEHWPESDTFSYVADLNFDPYKKIIKDIVALDVIKKRLNGKGGKRSYTTVSQYMADVKKMFENCRTFWKGSSEGALYIQHSEILESFFLSRLKMWLNVLNIVNKQSSKSQEGLRWSDLQMEWDLSKDQNKNVKNYSFQTTIPPNDITKSRSLTIEDYNYRNDPFKGALHSIILSNIPNPLHRRSGYYCVQSPLPNVSQKGQVISIPPVSYTVQEFKAKGAHGRIFRATIDPVEEGESISKSLSEKEIILKVQQPRREWEFYIAAELQDRLEEDDDKRWFMTIPECYTFNDGSIFTAKNYTGGRILDVGTKAERISKNYARELIATYFTIEMLHICEKLKKANIIHGDVHDENFMIQNIPSLNTNASTAEEMFENFQPSLILIDYGVSIDMSQFPKGTTFTHKFKKNKHYTVEMMENKPWTWQVDYFGLANITHSLLYGNYMTVKKVGTKYEPNGTPKRWMYAQLWNDFFHDFLNIENCESLPDLEGTRKKFEQYLFVNYLSKFPMIINELNLKMGGK